MKRFCQIAAAVVGGMSLSMGMIGCMAERPDTVSSNAIMETSGNRSLTWTASATGRVTVWDQTTDKVVYGSTVDRGQAVNVDVDKNVIRLDDQVVNQNSLHAGDSYKVFFEQTAVTDRNATVETHTVESTHGN